MNIGLRAVLYTGDKFFIASEYFRETGANVKFLNVNLKAYQ